MHIEIRKIEAPRFDGFVLRETGLSFPEFKGLFDERIGGILDNLRDAAGRLEAFCAASRKKKGRGGDAGLLQEAEAALATATKMLQDLSSGPVRLSEMEEEEVCRECGGPNGSVARVQIDDVISGLILNGGRVSSAVIANAYAAWYRVTRELRSNPKLE